MNFNLPSPTTYRHLTSSNAKIQKKKNPKSHLSRKIWIPRAAQHHITPSAFPQFDLRNKRPAQVLPSNYAIRSESLSRATFYKPRPDALFEIERETSSLFLLALSTSCAATGFFFSLSLGLLLMRLFVYLQSVLIYICILHPTLKNVSSRRLVQSSRRCSSFDKYAFFRCGEQSLIDENCN